MAEFLAGILGHAHIELDALHWLPDWEMRPLDSFRGMVTTATAAETWVADGNYSKVRDIAWARATTIVWMNYSRAVVLWRIVSRTLRRCVRREVLFSGNRENFSTAMFGRESIIVWSMSTFARRRRECPQFFQQPAYAHLTVVELRRPAQAAAFLAQLAGEKNVG